MIQRLNNSPSIRQQLSGRNKTSAKLGPFHSPFFTIISHLVRLLPLQANWGESNLGENLIYKWAKHGEIQSGTELKVSSHTGFLISKQGGIKDVFHLEHPWQLIHLSLHFTPADIAGKTHCELACELTYSQTWLHSLQIRLAVSCHMSQAPSSHFPGPSSTQSVSSFRQKIPSFIQKPRRFSLLSVVEGQVCEYFLKNL
jgi:hypothetical protein